MLQYYIYQLSLISKEFFYFSILYSAAHTTYQHLDANFNQIYYYYLQNSKIPYLRFIQSVLTNNLKDFLYFHENYNKPTTVWIQNKVYT